MTNKCGYFLGLLFYASEGGIANLLSVPALEMAGWSIHMETGKPVCALSPNGLLLTFKETRGLLMVCRTSIWTSWRSTYLK